MRTAQTIHFLKVDVEGAEREVLASSDWDAFRPIVVLVEAVEAWSTTPTHEAWEHILLDAEYEFAAFDGINRFYVDRDHHDLIPALAYPISALDRFVTASARDEVVAANERVHEAEIRVRELGGAQRHDQSEEEAERLGTSRPGSPCRARGGEAQSEQLGESLAQAQADVERVSQALETSIDRAPGGWAR